MFFLAVRKRVVSTVKKSCNGKKKGCLTVRKKRCFNDVSTMRKSYLDGVPTVRKNGCFDGEKKGISTVLEQ